MTSEQEQNESPRRRPWGGFVSLTGVATLCVAFFLPQVKSCGSPVVPVKEVVENGPACLAGPFIPFTVAILLTPLLALRLVLRSRRAGVYLTAGVCGICLLDLAGGEAWMAPVAIDNGPSLTDRNTQLMCGLLAALLLAALAAWRARLWLKAPGAMILAGQAAAGYFLLSSGEALYGLWVSMAGSVLLALGGFIEFLQARRRPP